MVEDPGAYQDDRAKVCRGSFLKLVAAARILDDETTDATNEGERILMTVVTVLAWAAREMEEEMNSWLEMAIRERQKASEAQ